MLSILIVFILLLTCVLTGLPISIGLAFSWLIIALNAHRQANWQEILQATWSGIKTAWVVVRSAP